MSTTKSVTGQCQNCGGTISFEAEATGSTANCPLCGQPTELVLAVPEHSSGIPKKAIVFVILSLVILVGGLIGAQIALKRARRLAGLANDTPPTATATTPVAAMTAPFERIGFDVTPVKIEKTAGSSLTHATGTIRNKTDRRRFGVTVELELIDLTGQKVGTAKDYQATLEPRAEWKFKAMLLDSKASSARITAIKEAQ